MTPLPAALGGSTLVAWRLDERSLRDMGQREGARLYGGRWNSRGRRIVYCFVDPATAILEVAVHKGFKALDTVPHVLTSTVIADSASVHVVLPGVVPNANWLRPGFRARFNRRLATACCPRIRLCSSRAQCPRIAGI